MTSPTSFGAPPTKGGVEGVSITGKKVLEASWYDFADEFRGLPWLKGRKEG